MKRQWYMYVPIAFAIIALTLSLIALNKKFKEQEIQTVSLPEIIVTMPVYPGEPVILPQKTLGGAFKAIESVSNITRKSSAQWKLAQLYWVDSEGFCRFNNYYAVAMGTRFGQRIGQTFEIKFADTLVEFDGKSQLVEGRTIFAILGDSKRDTDVENGICKENGSIVEFIVDTMDGNRLQQIMQGEVISITEIGGEK